MHLGLVLDMTSAGFPERCAVRTPAGDLTHLALAERSWAAADHLAALDAPALLYLGGNQLAFPVALFGAACAGVPLVPLNYRLSGEQLADRLAEHPGALLVHEGPAPAGSDPDRTVAHDVFVAQFEGVSVEAPLPVDPDLPAVLLYTSGTTSAPKAAVLRHRHLMAYLLGTVEFGAAEETDAALVSVPPYHVAGIANLLSNVYAGRRIVYLDQFDPAGWLRTVQEEGITQTMVVPTMLARIVEHLGDAEHAGTPTLRALSYGGSRMHEPVLRRALELFPDTGFVNAYGLTETSSTIALLGPDDHRAAMEGDAVAGTRLASVGKLLPGIEVEVRADDGTVLPVGDVGLVFLRGEQISGEYANGSILDDQGWFPTRDRGWIDEEGYLFIEGRADDTIIRGGENIAPAEIEDVLLAHEGVADAVVVGLPDPEWGQRLAAAVVAAEGEAGALVSAEELQELVRARLRSSKTPELIVFWPELPQTDTGKVVRRHVVSRLADAAE